VSRADGTHVLTRSLVRAVAELARREPAEVYRMKSGPEYPYGPDALTDRAGYQEWLKLTADRRGAIRRVNLDRLRRATVAPSISVVVPVYRPDRELLESCVASVVNQDFSGWQLCLCDDASNDPGTVDYLRRLTAADHRVVFTERSVNGGIAAATNSAAKLATGDFLAFLDQDDQLELGALADVALALLDEPDTDVLYTDQDKLELDGSRSEPFFKPDWSPDQLLSHMYVGHLLVMRRTLFEEVGALRPEYDGSQDYDLALRACERARRVTHVPIVAYHWRKIAGSTAEDYRAKPKADVAARAALTDALARSGEKGLVESGLHEGTFRIRREIEGEPLVSVIVPFHDGGELLRRCIVALQERGGYENWEMLLVDNLSWEPETRAVLNRVVQDPRCRVVPYPQPFNWARLNNFAAGQSKGEHLLFLNADVEGRSDGWLRAMLEHSQRPDVGPVGARLLYPNGFVQHAGVVMGLGGGIAWHAFCFCPAESPGYFGQAKLVRNCSAVTGACMMVKRRLFERFKGFDERLVIAFNDVDFCLRLGAAGFRTVYTPFAELIHEESAARGRSAREPLETLIMLDRWEDRIRNDPYFNVNLDRRRSEYALPATVDDEEPLQELLAMIDTWMRRSGATAEDLMAASGVRRP
jgi:O-antigen biosynthesis protein